jgi:hypothetical protein
MNEKQVIHFEETCAICLLNTISNPSMLTPCYHVFCIQCITPWLERSMGASCPLCKQKPTGIIFDIESEDKFEKLDLTNYLIDNKMEEEENEDCTMFDLPFNNRDKRFEVYFTPLECVLDTKNVHKLYGKFSSSYFNKMKSFISDATRNWIARDLKVLLRLEDVDLLCDLVMGLLSKIDIVKEEDLFVCNLVEYFANEREARHFVRELGLFLQSGLSMESYDSRAKYQCLMPQGDIKET